MSNLVKRGFVMNTSEEKRVINYNPRIDARLRELERARIAELREQGIEPEETFFEEGLEAESVEGPSLEEISAQAEDLINEAQAEANRILEDARREADQITILAQNKSLRLMEEQKYVGYQHGLEQAKAETDALKTQLQDEYYEKKEELLKEYNARSATMERDIVDVVIQVFEKVFGIQFQDKKDILLHLVRNTLMNVEIGKTFRIRLNETNRRFFENHLDDIKERVGAEVSVELVFDATLDDSECLIETDSGVFDCGIDMEMNNLVNDIRSLCS